MKRVRSVPLTVALLLIACRSASAAAPRIVIFSGPSLPHHVVISDWMRIFRFYEPAATAATVARSELTGRPRLRVSLFWGPRWAGYMADGRDPAALRPAQATQVAFYYPASRERPALLDIPSVWHRPRTVPPAALGVLRGYALPTSSR